MAPGQIGRMVDGVLGQVKLAALPFDAAEDSFSCGAQSGMVVRDNIFDAAHATLLKAFEKSTPMNLGLR